MSGPCPPRDTLEGWAWAFLSCPPLARFTLPEVPDVAAPSAEWSLPEGPLREGLAVVDRSEKSMKPGALRDPSQRAKLLHTFLHHEMQAAELMAWAILRWPEMPWAFRRGLATVLVDEVRHMNMYAEHMAALGRRYGELPVRDWFWQRVPRAASPAAFCAVMGMGLEAANLDHTARFAARFRAAGDEAGARLQEHVAEEELPHVRFGLHWFRRETQRDDFVHWASLLPPPMSPILMRGEPIDRSARARAGFSEAFTEALSEALPCRPFHGSSTSTPKTNSPAPGA